MLGCKSFAAAQGTLTGIVSCLCSRNNRWVTEIGEEGLTVAEQCYALAASSSPTAPPAHPKLSLHHNLQRNPPQSLMSHTRWKETTRPACLSLATVQPPYGADRWPTSCLSALRAW